MSESSHGTYLINPADNSRNQGRFACAYVRLYHYLLLKCVVAVHEK